MMMEDTEKANAHLKVCMVKTFQASWDSLYGGRFGTIGVKGLGILISQLYIYELQKNHTKQ